jgi:hypothetical protein
MPRRITTAEELLYLDPTKPFWFNRWDGGWQELLFSSLPSSPQNP